MLSQRQFLIIPVLACLFILISAITVQHHYSLAPCPLCMLQRFAIIGMLSLLVLWCAHNPRSKIKWLYSTLSLSLSVIGASLAARQAWIQHQPAASHGGCLPGLSYLFQNMPWGQALKVVLRGSTECGSVHWTFLNLSIASWSLISFIVIAILISSAMLAYKNN
jgi:protein dithiol:quinone oxidoreductase